MHKYLINHSTIRPERIVRLPDAFFRNAPDMTFRDLAFVVLEILIGDAFAPGELKMLIDRNLSDSRPFSPEAEASFTAALWRSTIPQGMPTLICMTEPEEMHLVKALADTPGVTVLVPRGHVPSEPLGVEFVEVQGSATDCLHLCRELERETSLCSLHNAAAAAVRVAVAIYRATHPLQPMGQANISAESAAMLRAYQTARIMGLPIDSIELSDSNNTSDTPITSSNHSLGMPHRRHVATRRVAPTVDAVMKIISSNQKTQS